MLYDWVFEVVLFYVASLVHGDDVLISATGLLVNVLFFLTPLLLWYVFF